MLTSCEKPDVTRNLTTEGGTNGYNATFTIEDLLSICYGCLTLTVVTVGLAYAERPNLNPAVDVKPAILTFISKRKAESVVYKEKVNVLTMVGLRNGNSDIR